MFKKFVAIVVILGFTFCSFGAYANDYNPATKLGRGLSNAATCWIEVPKQVWLVSKDRDPFTGLIYGSAKGVGYTIVRAASGVYDTAFFLLPPYDAPLTDDEFVFEGWE